MTEPAAAPAPAPAKQTPEELKRIRDEDERLTVEQNRRCDKIAELWRLTRRLKQHAFNALSYLDEWNLDSAEDFYEQSIETSNEALKEIKRLYGDPDFAEYCSFATPRPRSRSRSPASREKESKK